MRHLSDLGDSVGDGFPRAIGLAPKSRGRDLGAAKSLLGDDYSVVLSLTLSESFLARFEHALEEPDLEGWPLFSRAPAMGNLSLEQYLKQATLRSFAIAARHTMASWGLVRWSQVVREIVDRLRGAPAPFRAQAVAARLDLGELRRRVLGGADFSPDFTARLERQRPFIVIGNQLLVEMRPHWDFNRPATNKDIADITLLPEPWFDPIITTVVRAFANESAEAETAEDQKFCAGLAAARSPIRGTGELHAFTVSAPLPGKLKVSLDTGNPFFMEFEPGRVVLWPAAVVSVDADVAMMVGPRTHLAIRVCWCTEELGRREGSRSAEASGLARLASDLTVHPFVSREMTLCVGNTSARNRQLAQHASVADVILESHLRGAVRVFRYGWRGSNRNSVYRDLRAAPPPPGLRVISLAEAVEWIAAHPEIELVRWQP
jgi:hypothetical protein